MYDTKKKKKKKKKKERKREREGGRKEGRKEEKERAFLVLIPSNHELFKGLCFLLTMG